MLDQPLTNLHGCFRIVSTDVRADLVEVVDRRFGPDYFVPHSFAQLANERFTWSWLFDRPAAISARPLRIEAMICNSSAISSRDAFSGRRLRASSTACLSVMAIG